MLIGNLRFPGLPSWLSLIPRTAMSWDWQKEMEVSFALLSRPGRSTHCSKSSFKFRVIWILKCRISSFMSFRTLQTTWNSAVKDIFIPPCVFYNCGLLGRRRVSWEADSTGEKRWRRRCRACSDLRQTFHPLHWGDVPDALLTFSDASFAECDVKDMRMHQA